MFTKEMFTMLNCLAIVGIGLFYALHETEIVACVAVVLYPVS